MGSGVVGEVQGRIDAIHIRARPNAAFGDESFVS